MSNPHPVPASTRLSSTSDILSHIFSFLPSTSLHPLLYVSKTFFHSAAPHLYHTLSISPSSSSRNIFAGSKRSDNLTLDQKPLGDSTDPSNEIHKNSLLKYIKRVDVYIHGINECPFVKQFIEPLPNLEVVHLARGKRPSGEEEGNVCYGERCQFVNKVCINARRVIIRELDFSCLRRFEKLERVILKLRPCELPYYRGEGMARFRRQYDNQDQDVISRERDERELDDFSDIWFRSLYHLPPTVKRLDLVWWDESHKYRIDSYETTLQGFGLWGGGNEIERRIRVMKNCTCCDQLGCVRYSPHVGVQLPTLFKVLGKKTRIEHVGVWNFERVGGDERNQWRDYLVGYEELKDLLKKGFREGRQERDNLRNGYITSTSMPNGSNGTSSLDHQGGSEEEEEVITFHSGLEYYSTHSHDYTEIDTEEMDYWKDRFDPSPRLRELRRRALEEMEMGMDDWSRKDIELWNEDDCLSYLIERHNAQRAEEEHRAGLGVWIERIEEEDEEEEE
ncbi:hypothetical protein I302_105462 [Kwoniella bestiolae CBS 10118]|uniref:F-box domain-containing protein n=1 Tax=Kwoniella bestiolae CBS 10118 TaxID=1296100 RepID=A0A1B9FT73_9TREE|nr:hypothetical protein I302_08744 [Kwoniella bestiolae CBS 10118]OCF21963.1 hypothetical protein I302_08744 [Kwoniella bestiolae CBS 10118]